MTFPPTTNPTHNQNKQQNKIMGTIWTNKKLKGRTHFQIGAIGPSSGCDANRYNNEQTFTVRKSDGWHFVYLRGKAE